MHCDETDDPMLRHVETLAAETVRLGLHGRVTGSHLTSMYYVSKLLDLMTEARLNIIANPLIKIMTQGRHDTYPKRRGMTTDGARTCGCVRARLRYGPVVLAGGAATCWKWRRWPSMSGR
jgi:cytosine/adenosine deaminase-related metal-dependent hydrolase